MDLLDTTLKNKVLQTMEQLLEKHRDALLRANSKDLEAFTLTDRALYDRLVVNNDKIDGMIQAVRSVREQDDPVNREISHAQLANGLRISNRTAPFGTILIIYESRPDVTVEAAVLAFKANNTIFLKGGKEALHSNTELVKLWHRALEDNGLSSDYIQLLTLDREKTRAFLRNPPVKLDLIVPRGGERLIAFVKEHAQCAVLVSGRGNNFLYLDKNADWGKSVAVALNAKTQKISACNAVDKILIHKELPGFKEKVRSLAGALEKEGVELLVDDALAPILPEQKRMDEALWKTEFLAMKCCLAAVADTKEAVNLINEHSGGHSASIMTENQEVAHQFMQQVDCAAVYHNASTRFTDGGQMGVGAELAISTDKLHHRGPLGLEQLVTNKYHVFGDGQVRA
ncbi:glutamate-5-semialdehyde dehydrogenase [Maribacter sp. 2307ULW6-5]|uniref:glutamate-5-semialdehyde dehydrogenase n=1 Tax=Maribacter sp. 2307ULW6-5 TaxID=3386275 RepID=UPI0039BC6F03